MRGAARRWARFRRGLWAVPGGFGVASMLGLDGVLRALPIGLVSNGVGLAMATWLLLNAACLAVATWLHVMLTAKIHAVTGWPPHRNPSPTVLFFFTQFLLVPLVTSAAWGLLMFVTHRLGH